MSVTLVTALYDIDRGTKGDGRSFDEYLDWFAKTLKTKSPMVVFVDESLKEFVEKNRKGLPTKVITQSLEEIPYYELNNDIQKVLDDEDFKGKVSCPSRVECKMSLYNVVIFSKFPWVKRVIEENPFDTEYFMWMDAGLSRFFGPHDVNINMPYPSEAAQEVLLSCKDTVLIQATMNFYTDLVESEGIQAWHDIEIKDLIDDHEFCFKLIFPCRPNFSSNQLLFCNANGRTVNIYRFIIGMP